VLEHLQTGDPVKTARLFRSKFLHGLLSVIHLDTRLKCMKLRDINGVCTQVNACDLGTATRHRLTQDAAATAHVQHLLVLKRAGAFLDVAQA